MIPRHCRPPGCLKSNLTCSPLFKGHRRPFHASQCAAADKSGGPSPPAGNQTRKAASAAASREIQNLRPTVDLRNRGVKSPPTGAPVVRPSASPAIPRGGRAGGKFVRNQREGGDKAAPRSAADRNSGSAQPARSPRDAPFKYGPRRIGPQGGPGGNSFRGRSQNAGAARSRPFRGPNADNMMPRDNDLNEDETDGLVEHDASEKRTIEGWLADEVSEKLRYPTEEEKEVMMNEDHWVRLECATMEPVHEALPTFKPAEITAASLLSGRAALPIGTKGVDEMVELQMKRATKRADLVTTTHDFARQRFRKGHLVSFDSQEEMEWALHRRTWEAKAKKIITGEHVAFKDAAERGAVTKLVTEEVIKSVQERYQNISISTKDDLQKDGIQLELNELAALDRLAMYEKESQLPKDPEQAELMRTILNIPTITEEERKKLDEKYPEFVPVDSKIRNQIMDKMVAGKYSLGAEKGIAASVQQLTLNNGSYLPSKQTDLLDKIKSYVPQENPK